MSNLQCKKKLEKIIFFNYCPLQIWTLTICNQDISKTIKARIFKHGLLIQDDGRNLKKLFYFIEVIAFREKHFVGGNSVSFTPIFRYAIVDTLLVT